MIVPHLRWVIIGLIFLATLINYIDRLTVSVLAPVITRELQLSNLQFATIATWFLVAYTISQAVSGRLIDQLGTRRGMTLSVTIWSIAAMATSFARSLTSLIVCRFVLGFGEAGNWPGAAKVVAEWFPVRERAFAMAIFNSGAALGAVIAPPVIVLLQLRYGWQTTFLVTGGLGFVWLIAWLAIYEVPARHRWLGADERRLIDEGQPAVAIESDGGAVRWRDLLRHREVWAIVLARVLCDPTWWLYITWLPKYLSDVRGFSLAEIGLYAWVPYLAADAGSLVGGAASGWLIARGWAVHDARRAVIVAAALLMPVGALAVRAENAMVALVMMSAVLFGFQVWINNVQVIPSDLFPQRLVGSVAGLGGFGAGLGSMTFTLLTGWIVDHLSYTAVFTVAALLAPLGTLTLLSLLGRGPRRLVATATVLVAATIAVPSFASAESRSDAAALPTFESLLQHPVRLKPELEGVHPRVFVTAAEIEALRVRARTTHRESWSRVIANLAAVKSAPPPAPGPQERRSQNVVAFTIAEISLAYQIERRPEYLEAARRWVLAAIDYEPWGYTYYKPNVDLAAGHLLYAIGWAYDLLYQELTPDERARIRRSLERHAGLVYDALAPSSAASSRTPSSPKKFAFTQNHDFIPASGLAIAALALLGESTDAPKWAALARAHHHRAGTLLSPDGYYYEGMEYWIFSAPWLVHFLDAWEHSTGESLWEQGPFRHWPLYVAHMLLPDGQQVFDFGDVWEGPLTRAGQGQEYSRVYPGGRLQSNFNVLSRIASRFHDAEAQAIAARCASVGHSNLEEYWTLLWHDATLAAAPMSRVPLSHHFADTGVVVWRSSWEPDATAFAIKAGPPEGHAVTARRARAPEWELSSGHAHPDVASFIIYARGRYLTGDSGYAGLPQARHHNTITVGGIGQGHEASHDVWEHMPYDRLDGIRITEARLERHGARVVLNAAAAYPDEAGLSRFTRTFTLTGSDGLQGAGRADRFQIVDEIETTRAVPVQWWLQSDTPFASRDNVWTNATTGTNAIATSSSKTSSGQPGIEVRVTEPTQARTEAAPTRLTAPGKPGSITEGAVDERGHHLLIESPAATHHRFDVTLTVAGAR